MQISKYFSAVFIIILMVSCASGDKYAPVAPSTDPQTPAISQSADQADHNGQYINWGLYQLEIGRDGSYANVIPDRYATGDWGYHLNVVKLLEVDPCTDCLKLSNIHLTPEGDVSVDISITHPWPLDNLYCTGFDVRGIIMFPASQLWPDNELRVLAGLGPYGDGEWKRRWSSYEKGNSELMNPDGWTSIWAPDSKYLWEHDLDEGLPIFEYYPGKFASGENLGTINAYKRFYSNENRHMFEPGKTVKRTYIIRPPAVGPIEASYAIYAHWAPPTTVPVTDPAVDFGLRANAPSPYEFWIEQDGVIDPDNDGEPEGNKIHWHVKTWYEPLIPESLVTEWDLLYEVALGMALFPHPDGMPDDYILAAGPDHDGAFCVRGYKYLNIYFPDTLPGEWTYIFRLHMNNPLDPHVHDLLATDYYICKIAIDESEFEW